jgi:hypothetical protein
MRKSQMLGGVLILAALAAPAALADMSKISFGATTEHGNKVSATFFLDWNGTDLTVSVANTSKDKSVITGWGLMGGSIGKSFAARGTLDDKSWFQANKLTLSPKKQFGTFDFGADTPPNGLESGKPKAGVLAGTTATFTFHALRSPVKSANDFLTTLNSNGLAVVARWQNVGLCGNDSAKAGGAGEDDRFVIVPAPDSTMMACVGMTVAAIWRRRWL